MLGEIKVRAATVADREPVCELVRAVLEEYGLSWDGDGIDADLVALPGSYRTRGGTFDVLVDGTDRVLGAVGLWPLSADVVELRKMYFSPALRGRGVGKAILDRALRCARAQGYGRVELETARVLDTAIALYRRFGFEILPDESLERRCDYRMGRTLDDYRAPAGLVHIEEMTGA